MAPFRPSTSCRTLGSCKKWPRWNNHDHLRDSFVGINQFLNAQRTVGGIYSTVLLVADFWSTYKHQQQQQKQHHTHFTSRERQSLSKLNRITFLTVLHSLLTVMMTLFISDGFLWARTRLVQILSPHFFRTLLAISLFERLTFMIFRLARCRDGSATPFNYATRWLRFLSKMRLRERANWLRVERARQSAWPIKRKNWNEYGPSYVHVIYHLSLFFFSTLTKNERKPGISRSPVDRVFWIVRRLPKTVSHVAFFQFSDD